MVEDARQGWKPMRHYVTCLYKSEMAGDARGGWKPDFKHCTDQKFAV